MANKKLSECLKELFVVNGEMVPENGEDWFVYSCNRLYGLLSACDGCGGIGSRKYSEYSNKSGAFIASHIASSAIYYWFKGLDEQTLTLSGNSLPKLCESLKDAIVKELQKYDSPSGGSAMKGALVQSFPTTLSTILFTIAKNELYASYIWAGDSRGYLLTETGLVQITRDDIEATFDALDNLTGDSKLSNMVNSKGDFQLNSRIITHSLPAVLITATDGAFGYLTTPMEFEYMLLHTLSQSRNAQEWKAALNASIRKVTGDDYTLGIATLGYSNFSAMKRRFDKRRKELFDRYISRIPNGSQEDLRRLWEAYKANYYPGR